MWEAWIKKRVKKEERREKSGKRGERERKEKRGEGHPITQNEVTVRKC